MNTVHHAQHMAHAICARVRTANPATALAFGDWSTSAAIPAYVGKKPAPPRRPSVPA